MLACDDLLRPQRLWSGAAVLSRPSPVPKIPRAEPWAVEEYLISTLHLPLNLDHNRRCGFHQVLSWPPCGEVGP